MAAAVNLGNACICQLQPPGADLFSVYIGPASLTTYCDNPKHQHFVKLDGARVTLRNYTNDTSLFHLIPGTRGTRSEVEDLRDLYPERDIKELKGQLETDAKKPSEGNPFTGYAIFHREAKKIIGQLSFRETAPGIVGCRMRIHPDYQFQGYGIETLYLAAHLANWIKETGFQTGEKGKRIPWERITFPKPTSDRYMQAFKKLMINCRAHQTERGTGYTEVKNFPKVLEKLEHHKTLVINCLVGATRRTIGALPSLPSKGKSTLGQLKSQTEFKKGREVSLTPRDQYAEADPVEKGFLYVDVDGEKRKVEYDTSFTGSAPEQGLTASKTSEPASGSSRGQGPTIYKMSEPASGSLRGQSPTVYKTSEPASGSLRGQGPTVYKMSEPATGSSLGQSHAASKTSDPASGSSPRQGPEYDICENDQDLSQGEDESRGEIVYNSVAIDGASEDTASAASPQEEKPEYKMADRSASAAGDGIPQLKERRYFLSPSVLDQISKSSE